MTRRISVFDLSAEKRTRFRARLERYLRVTDDVDACILWTGYTLKGGRTLPYGRIRLRNNPDIFIYVHRAMYELSCGRRAPKNKEVRHSCDNPTCCNPSHLRIGTHGQNMSDAAARGRIKTLRGEKNRLAKLTFAQAQQIRERHLSGEPQLQLSIEFNVSTTVICRIIHNKAYT